MPESQVIESPSTSGAAINVDSIPQHEMDNLCRVVLRCAAEAFKNPAFRAEYEEWLKKRHEKQKRGKGSQ